VLTQDLPEPVTSADVSRLFHQLNNQLGIILANAELLESRLTDATHRARASQVVASALDAIDTARRVRQLNELS
jgi:GAF domain-containing protein